MKKAVFKEGKSKEKMMEMITNGSVLRRHAKSGGFVELNAEDVHFTRASVIVFVLPQPRK